MIDTYQFLAKFKNMLTVHLNKYNKNWIYNRSLFLVLAVIFLWHTKLQAGEQPRATQYVVTPYLWAASIGGTTAVSDDGSPPVESPPIDSDYSFFSLDNLDGVASATFTERGQHWSLLFDFLYVAYEDTFFGGSVLQATPRLEGRIFELAGTYQPESIKNLDIVAGLRRQNIDVALTFVNRTPHDAVNWIDPFIGVIYTPPLSNKWFLSLRGDIGGFGIESDTAINFEAMLHYQFGKTFSGNFGYRYLKVEFEDSTLVYNVSLDGFLFGLGIHF